MGTGWETPARVINALVNGPGFYLGRFIPLPMPEALNEFLNYDADRLSGIALFWFLVGWSIDRRRNKQAIDNKYPIGAGILFSIGALVCGVFVIASVIFTFDQYALFWKILVAYPFRSWETMTFGTLVWLGAFSAYFARRAFIAVTRKTKERAGSS